MFVLIGTKRCHRRWSTSSCQVREIESPGYWKIAGASMGSGRRRWNVGGMVWVICCSIEENRDTKHAMDQQNVLPTLWLFSTILYKGGIPLGRNLDL